jgi:hypothetical protein
MMGSAQWKAPSQLTLTYVLLLLLPVSCRSLHEMGVFEGSDPSYNSGRAGNGFLAADAHSMRAVVTVFCKAACVLCV